MELVKASIDLHASQTFTDAELRYMDVWLDVPESDDEEESDDEVDDEGEEDEDNEEAEDDEDGDS